MMAMPKSLSEQIAIQAYLQSQTFEDEESNVWLGARFHEDRWQWGDGSEVCGYKDWQHGFGGSHKTAIADRFMSLTVKKINGSVVVGKWVESNHDVEEYPVLCESMAPEHLCPEGTLSGVDLDLTTDPGLSKVVYHGYCFYLGHKQESCHKTCAAQMGGSCDRKATRFAGHTMATCRVLVDRFGNLDYSSAGSYKDDNTGCSFGNFHGEAGLKGWVQIMKKAPSAAAPLGGRPDCSGRSADPFRHRVCGCLDDSKWIYPTGHKVVQHETVRLRAAGYSATDESVIQFKGESSGTVIFEFRIQYDQTAPWISNISRNSIFEDAEGSSVGTAEKGGGFQLLGSDHYQTIDFKYGPTHWHISIDGVYLKEYDYQHRTDVKPVSVYTQNWIEPVVLLLPQDPEHPMSYDSDNGCLKQSVRLETSTKLTMEFKMRAIDTIGYRVIRANRGIEINGVTLSMLDGLLQFELRGAQPETYKFTSFTFQKEQEYSLTVIYDHVSKWVMLYKERVLVQKLIIQIPIRAKIRDGQIGCWDDYDQFVGTIHDFWIFLGDPVWMQGDKGEPGDRGKRGRQGKEGPRVMGEDGPRGRRGIQGPPGEEGPQGEIGPTSWTAVKTAGLGGACTIYNLLGVGFLGFAATVTLYFAMRPKRAGSKRKNAEEGAEYDDDYLNYAAGAGR
jgi:hypothetical protein